MDFPPYEFLDGHGQPAGLNVDLIRAVGRARGLEVRVELRPWSEVLDGLRRGEVDVAAMYRTPERARVVDFTVPHELVYHEMYVRRGASPPRALADLAGRTVLVQAGTYAAEALQALGVPGAVKGFPSEPAVLHALARGDGDAAVVTQTVTRPFRGRRELGDAVQPAGPPVLLAEYGFVTRRGQPQLLEALNEGVTAVKATGEYDRLYDRWLGAGGSAERAQQAAWGLAAAVGLALAALGWNGSLRRKVAAQTLALRREFAIREQAQAELAERERAGRQSQKMEALGRMAGGISHDFNNILTVIVSYAAFLRERLAELGQDTAEADEILDASERATRLTRQLLAFSRATPAEIRPLDLAALVKSVTPMLQRLVGEHIQLVAQVPLGPVVVQGDRTQLEQVLLNLSANARDAMPEGGRLSVALTVRASGSTGASPGEASLAVSDTGSGMDEAVQARIFDPFFTTKEPGSGTGLGLATVFANVRSLGGRIGLASAPGQGSTFTVTLPLATGEVLGEERARAPTGPEGAGEVILLVEDDPVLRRAGQRALERAGHRVFEAGDGEQGLSVAQAAPSISVVVSDVVLPGRSGPRMVEELRTRREGLLVLYASGHVHEELDLAVPGTAFLLKPFTPQALVDAVSRLVKGARSAAPEAKASHAARPGRPAEAGGRVRNQVLHEGDLGHAARSIASS